MSGPPLASSTRRKKYRLDIGFNGRACQKKEASILQPYMKAGSMLSAGNTEAACSGGFIRAYQEHDHCFLSTISPNAMSILICIFSFSSA